MDTKNPECHEILYIRGVIVFKHLKVMKDF